MNNLCWEVFKKTGSIEAYLYIKDQKQFTEDIEELRENDITNDSFEHPGDST